MSLWKAIVIVLALATAPRAFAGWCPLAGDLETQTHYSFFRGTVVRVDAPPMEVIRHDDGRVEVRGQVTTRFAVTEDYSGVGDEVTVTARHGSVGSADSPPDLSIPKTTSRSCKGDCSRSFELGHSYFVALRDDGRTPQAGTCNGGVTEEVVAEWTRTGRDPTNPVRTACGKELYELDHANAFEDTLIDDRVCREELANLAELGEDTRVTVAGILNPGACREYRFGRTPEIKEAFRGCRLSLPIRP